MVTCLIEMGELTNFGHVSTSTIQFERRNKILLATPWMKIMTS